MFCCTTLVGWAADTPMFFTVWLNNGQITDFQLSEKPTVKFAEGVLMFETSSSAIEYNASEVKEFTLETLQASGIKSASGNSNHCVVNQLDNMLSISGAEPYAKVLLYNAGGKLILTNSADDKGTLHITLNSLDHGVYILKIATTTIKIMRR